jgi:hypothetical protein
MTARASQEKAMNLKTAENGWDRADVNVRLSKRRKDKLKAVAATMPDGATPLDAMDHALRVATSDVPLADRLDAFEDAMEADAMQRRFEIDHLEAAVKQCLNGISELRALIASLAEAEDF